MSCDPEVPQFTQEQKEEFSKLVIDFLVRNFQESIPAIEVEVRFKLPITERVVEKIDSSAVQLYMVGCRQGEKTRPGDPCPPGFCLG
jgi:hypothetical protein